MAIFERKGLIFSQLASSTAVEGDLKTMLEALAMVIHKSLSAGANSVRVHIGGDAKAIAVSPLHTALETMFRAAERSIGAPAKDWTRSQKQQVVKDLDQQGAFMLRGAVDDLARMMGVSRITIYNYLNSD